ncbi:hypothetical protein K457DRAFT_132435 [Linnemannia elongata AG-77]|uniref:F-box domain-containing protein n=1 Tax=Linnemannia elongata AG-77 TaxID=1314771 RepID=A0A197KE12_9FUNG|nr:hypothetical protein K457DRAFT_132435 [Linnemannia elongata AG-77]
MQHATSATSAAAGAGTPPAAGGGRACLDSKLTRHHPLVQPVDNNNNTTTTSSSFFAASLEIPPYKPKRALPKNQLEEIPLDILIQIALFLPCPAFASLLQTCRYVYYNLDTRWVWHQRFVLQLGRGLLIYLLNPRDYRTRELVNKGVGEMKDTSVVAKKKIVEWYWMYTRTAVSPKEMYICHRDDYWKFVSDSRSPYGLVAKLESGLWWLDVSAVLFGIRPGRYRVQWGLALDNRSCASGVQFRVAAFSRDEVPEWHNEEKNTITYTPSTTRNFLNRTTATNKENINPSEAFIFQLPQVLVVETEKPTVFVQMRSHGTYRTGLTVLFVRVVPAGEDEVDEEEDVEEDVEEDSEEEGSEED